VAELTFSIPAQDQDGFSEKEGVHGAWPPAGATNTVTSLTNDSGGLTRKGTFPGGGFNSCSSSLLRFDTSALPNDATVTAAVLRLSITAKATAEVRDLNIEHYDSGAAISDDDYTVNVGTTAAQVASATWQAWATTGTVDVSLSNLSNISLTGITGLRIGIDGGAPSTGGGDIDTRLNYAEFGHASRAIPQLIVTYTVGDSVLVVPPIRRVF
jgi:hypothetical protein